MTVMCRGWPALVTEDPEGKKAVGRLSQVFWAINAEEMPTVEEAKHHFSHIDLVDKDERKKVAALRRRLRGQAKPHAENEPTP
jgi:hypothetical protein